MFNFFKKKQTEVTKPKERKSQWSTHFGLDDNRGDKARDLIAEIFRKQPIISGEFAQDDSSNGFPSFKQYNNQINSASDTLVFWYSTQGFIGHQLCGIIAQNWLINKACSMPAVDAVRKGYNIVSIDGDDLDPEATKLLKRYDRKMGINKHLREFIRKGRIFGVRIAMFKVDSTDPLYYENPFNIDGVTPGSYKGIVQIDPYWTAPLLDQAGASQPDSLHFYEPSYWMINGKKVHRSHLIIFRHSEPVDVLKPQYLYGGVPLPQQIMERVYAAERTANEAPQLAMTKRISVWLTDMEAVMADTTSTVNRLNDWAMFRDNYGIKLGDKEGDEYSQFDTSLADMDALIMTQYQLVCAQSGVPSTKMLGTSPKGFGASGEYEEASYHEMLESLQESDLTPFLERHHALVMQAYVVPALGAMDIETTVQWNPLDTPTAKELADTNLVKAQTGLALIQAGAIDSSVEQRRVATDKTSGYHDLGLEDMDIEPLESDNDQSEE